MKLLLSKFVTPKGGTAVSQGISCLPARFIAEAREKPFGEVLGMLGELPHAARGLHSWLLMSAPPVCSRPGCCREVKPEDGFGCRTCCVPAICLWADPTAVLWPFQLLHPHSERYTEGISHPLLASPHFNTVPRLKKRERERCFVKRAENIAYRLLRKEEL